MSNEICKDDKSYAAGNKIKGLMAECERIRLLDEPYEAKSDRWWGYFNQALALLPELVPDRTRPLAT